MGRIIGVIRKAKKVTRADYEGKRIYHHDIRVVTECVRSINVRVFADADMKK